MNIKQIFLAIFFLETVMAHAQTSTPDGFAFVDHKDRKEVDVLYKDTLLTAYCYYDSVMKPILFPVNTVSGITVTRGFPLAPRPGDDTDHPHQVGIWLDHENVNGIDFWNSSPAIPKAKRSGYGRIVHDRVVSEKADGDNATLEVSAQWRKWDNTVLLAEATRYEFHVIGPDFIIDRITTLIALRDTVKFNDAKDALFGIRVTPELELPNARQVGDDGKLSGPKVNNPLATGNFISSEGVRGDSVWGTRAMWVTMFGTKDKKPISVTIIDHPQNPGYPAYWHARGYGLLAINPLGDAVFTNGKKHSNFRLTLGQQATFRYRVVIHEGPPLTKDQTNHYAYDFKGVD